MPTTGSPKREGVQELMRRLGFLLRYSDPRLIGFFNALYAFWWGFWLILPFRTFGVSTVYQTMARMGPEWVWGSVYLIVGLSFIIALALNKLCWCKRVGYVILFLWLLLVAMYGIGDYRGLGVVVYSVTSVASAWVCVRFGILEKVARDAANE